MMIFILPAQWAFFFHGGDGIQSKKHRSTRASGGMRRCYRYQEEVSLDDRPLNATCK
jgi:hypothetical protein